MRKLSFFLTFALVLTLAYGALAQTNIGVVAIDNVTNTLSPTELRAGQNHLVSLRYTFVGLDSPIGWAVGNTFEVYSPDGANWVNLLAADGGTTSALPITVSRYRKYYTSINSGVNWVATVPGGGPQPGGSTGAASRVGYSLATISFDGSGYLPGSTGIALTLQFQSLQADSTKTMCFDTTKASGAVAWEWASGSLADWPHWDNGLGAAAPRCWTLVVPDNIPPEWVGPAVANPTFNHCGEATLDLNATDPDDGPDPLTYVFAPGYETGFGTLNPSTGVWTWSGPTVPQSGTPLVEFLAYDGADFSVPFQANVVVTNNAPTIACGAISTVSAGACKDQTVVGADADVCDVSALTYTFDATGIFGTVSMLGNVITFCPTAADAGVKLIPVTVSDGSLSVSCNTQWNVIIGSPYQVEIEKVEDQSQGQYADVFIKLHKFDITQGLGGFDFLVAYDASALSFQLAFEGEIYDQCDWEYFTYRYGATGNCNGACPSGLLRIVGLAETNNGFANTTCGDLFISSVPVTLAEMRFLVTNDRTLECQYVPIRFFWYDCGDNVLSNADGSEAYLSAKVFEFTELNNPFQGGAIEDPTAGFPTFQGAQAECYTPEDAPKVAKGFVDFQNGGIDIVCADSIDAPGDINLNGVAYEIADAVMFTNYFVSGLGAFTVSVEGSIAASDTNKDGIALSVADLVYLIRVIIGDALPYDKISPVAARVTVDRDGTFSSNQALGGAYVVVAGDVTPTLLADGMEMQYGFNGQNTNIIVWSREGNSCSGEFLQADGPVVSTEFAAFNGAPVIADVMPADFQLHQNYPNPFNPVTNIKVEIPVRGAEWKLNIYNVTGQLVQSFNGVSATGFEEVTWDASGVSSGVYFYKLTSGDFSATKKAVLLK
jgi:hypothetical protein